MCFYLRLLTGIHGFNLDVNFYFWYILHQVVHEIVHLGCNLTPC